MSGNTFGKIFTLTTFGESHGKALGCIIDGCPPGILLTEDDIQKDLDRRKPGQSKFTTQRKESDKVEILSGVFEGKTTGTPISLIIFNEDQRSKDYGEIKDKFRPGHADYTYSKKYGFRDYRGGGRSSARETVVRVVAGSIAKMLLKDVKINAFVSSVGEITYDYQNSKVNFDKIEDSIVRCPDEKTSEEMISLIKSIKKNGDTVGGVISCIISGVPVGLGEPVFNKLHAELGKAMLSINAVKGFEFGSGFKGSSMKGSEHNDSFNADGTTKTNRSGGIQGGISNGMDIYFNVAFKPVSTIMKDQDSIDSDGNEVKVKGKGRHDPCVVPRAVPIVEAMSALVLADYHLLNRLSKI